jgi:hypothetical protein
MDTTMKRPVAIKRPLITNHQGIDINSEVVNTIYKTTNYDMFGYFDGNRDIIPSHVANLEISLQENQLEVPIVVNEFYLIADGQNRFEACKNLGLPVYYMVISGLTLRDIQRLNSNVKTWSWKHVLESCCKLKMKDYIMYREFFNSYKIQHTECMQLLSGNTSLRGGTKTMARAFNDGQFKVGDQRKAVDYANKITKLGEYYDGFTRKSFVRAVIHLLEDKPFFDNGFSKYRHDLFVKRLSKKSQMFNHQINKDDYLRAIEDVYNYGCSKKVRFI